jgi:predicted AAA+ superfamily ATPase
MPSVSLKNSREEECFTWSIQGGAEVDLVLTRRKGNFGFEFKAGDAPQRTTSMLVAVNELKLARLFVIYPGEMYYALDDKIEAVGFKNLKEILPLMD